MAASKCWRLFFLDYCCFFPCCPLFKCSSSVRVVLPPFCEKGQQLQRHLCQKHPIKIIQYNQERQELQLELACLVVVKGSSSFPFFFLSGNCFLPLWSQFRLSHPMLGASLSSWTLSPPMSSLSACIMISVRLP